MTQLSFDRPADTAHFSPDGAYRYQLTRELGGNRPLVICGLNPSTATAAKNDPTITKETGFARRWGCGLLVKVNAYGFVATKPAVMKRWASAGHDIVGPENDRWIMDAVFLARERAGIFLVAWGNHIDPERQRQLDLIIRMIVDPVCLGTNGNGTPVHPLYIPYERQVMPWKCL